MKRKIVIDNNHMVKRIELELTPIEYLLIHRTVYTSCMYDMLTEKDMPALNKIYNEMLDKSTWEEIVENE